MTRLSAVGLLAAGFLVSLAALRAADAPAAKTTPETAQRPAELRMAADGSFFAGQVGVQIDLGSGPGRRPADGEKSPGSAGEKGERFRRHRNPPPGGGGEGGGGRMPPGGMPGADAEGPAGARVRESHNRPLMLHLSVTNHGDQPVDVEVADFNSALGNFVVLPSRFKLQPGETAEAEPMTSRLGIGSAEVPVTVRLKLAGKSDQQVLKLHLVTPEPPAEKTPEAPPPAPGNPGPG